MGEDYKSENANEPEGVYMSISEWNLLKKRLRNLKIELPKTDNVSFRSKIQKQAKKAELDIKENRIYSQDEMIQKVKGWKS